MDWIYFVTVLWGRKWRILIPTLILVLITGVVSFLLPSKWEVDAVISPSKFMVQTQQGQFEEVIVVDPRQVAGQINEKSYDRIIADELKISIRKFPKLKAENLADTNLVMVALKEKDIDKGKSILTSLFSHLKREFDKKIEVEIKGLDSGITTLQNQIKRKELDIQSAEIAKEKVKQQIASAENKLKISEDRYQSIT
jgi:LPS O-antigen subunit length determinant protein (WzzB/FepE family)